LPFTEDKKSYIVETLDPILEEMVSDVLTDVPDKPIGYMVSWLRRRSGLATKAKESLAEKNSRLKQELSAMRSSIEEAGTAIQTEDKHDEDEDEEDDDECDEIPESFRKPEAQIGRARQSVSAEAYGAYNQKQEFICPEYKKTDTQKERLKNTLSLSWMFSSLDVKDVNTIILAMKEVKMVSEQKVISEGENGDYLFVIESGVLDCLKEIDGKPTVVKQCQVGDVFGELALLYNCPRAATVVAKGDCICWQLDRDTFNHIVKDAAVRRRSKYESFLKNVALIANLDQSERSHVADALVCETFKKGDYIVRQDEPGDKFYILEEGQLYAMKSIDNQSKRVMDYKPGDYFGELALLKNQPRAASVIVQSDEAKVLCMSRVSFTKMLGPLNNLLMRNVSNYK